MFVLKSWWSRLFPPCQGGVALSPHKGISIHVGINYVNPNAYGGWRGELAACVQDAKDMQALAEKQGFSPAPYYNEDAKAVPILGSIVTAAGLLQAGDTLLLTYSGHGGQTPDTSSDEEDGKDETWVLYDRQVLDDELHALWAKFAPGVRILVLSDSCHSGTVARAPLPSPMLASVMLPHYGVARAMPSKVALADYHAREALYRSVKAAVANPPDVAASVVLISGCLDHQVAMDGVRNGAFTDAVLRTWNNGHYYGSLPRFRDDVAKLLPSSQIPNYLRVGKTDLEWESRPPFTL
jgi:hypothetical protein